MQHSISARMQYDKYRVPLPRLLNANVYVRVNVRQITIHYLMCFINECNLYLPNIVKSNDHRLCHGAASGSSLLDAFRWGFKACHS